jgi:hypothetical protein
MPFDSTPSDIAFRQETWADYARDAEPLWREHSALTSLPISLNATAYETLEAHRALVIISARKAGRMIGYFTGIVTRHLHHDVIAGMEDGYFLTAGERRGLTGYRLLKAGANAMMARGALLLLMQGPVSDRHARMMQRLGFLPVETAYRRVVA